MFKKKTDIRLDLAMNYTTKYTMTVDSRTLSPKKNKGYSRLRVLRKKAANVLIGIAIVFMMVIPAAPAYAETDVGKEIVSAWCKGSSFMGGAPMPTPDFMTPKKPASGKLTGAEKFGFFPQTTSFLGWYGTDEAPDTINDKGWKDSENAIYGKSNPAGCMRTEIISIAGLTFIAQNYNGFLSAVASMEVSLAFGEDTTLIKTMKDRIGTIVSGKQPGSDDVTSEGLVQTLYLDWLIIPVTLGAIYLGYVGLIKRRSTEAIHAAIWMLASTTLGLLFLTKPMVIIDEMDKGVGSITGGAMTAISKSAFTAPEGSVGTNLCEVPTNVGTEREQLVRKTQCMIWDQFIYQPLVQSQFGSANEDLQRTEKMPHGVDLGGVEASPRSWATYQLDQQVVEANATQADIDAKNEAKLLLPIHFVGEPSAGVPGSGAINKNWTGENPQRVLPIVFSAIANSGFFIVITFLSFGKFIFQLGIVFLMAISPLVLLVGVHPGLGRSVALTWVETVISYMLKQLIYGVFIAFSVLFFGILLTAKLDVVWLAFGTIALTIIIIKNRNAITDKMSAVNLGGNGPVNMHGAAEGAADNVAARTASGVAGLAGGALAAGIPGAGGATGRIAHKFVSAVAGAASPRAQVSKSLTEDEGTFVTTASAPKTSTNSGSGTKAPHRVGLPAVGGSDSKVAGLIGSKSATSGGKNGMGAKASTSSMAKINIPKIEKPNKAGGKHVATSAKAPVKAPSFTKALPDAPMTSSTAGLVAKGAFNGAVSGFKNGGGVVGGLGAGVTAGKEVTTNAATADAAKIREAEREVKAAEKSEEARYQERRKAAEAERVAKEKERSQAKEKVGALPVSKSTAKGLPRSTGKPLGLPARSTSQTSGGTSRAGGR